MSQNYCPDHGSCDVGSNFCPQCGKKLLDPFAEFGSTENKALTFKNVGCIVIGEMYADVVIKPTSKNDGLVTITVKGDKEIRYSFKATHDKDGLLKLNADIPYTDKQVKSKFSNIFSRVIISSEDVIIYNGKNIDVDRKIVIEIEAPVGVNISVVDFFGECKIGDIKSDLNINGNRIAKIKAQSVKSVYALVQSNTEIDVKEALGKIISIIESSGNVQIESGKATDLDVFISSNGNFSFKGDVLSGEIKLRTTGSGNIEIAGGKSELLDALSTSNGKIIINKKIVTNSVSLISQGSGKIIFKEGDATNLNLVSESNGDITFSGNVIGENINIETSGSGTIEFKGGEVKNLTANSKRSGSIVCSGSVTSDKVLLSSSGSGDIKLDGNVKSTFEASVASNGDIKFTGNVSGKIVKVQTTGSGCISIKSETPGNIEYVEAIAKSNGNIKLDVLAIDAKLVSEGSGNVKLYNCKNTPVIRKTSSGSVKVG